MREGRRGGWGGVDCGSLHFVGFVCREDGSFWLGLKMGHDGCCLSRTLVRVSELVDMKKTTTRVGDELVVLGVLH